MKKTLIAIMSLACASLVPTTPAEAARPGQTRVVWHCQNCGGPVYQKFDRRDGWETLNHQCSYGSRRYSRDYDRDHDRRHRHRHHDHSDRHDKRDLAEQLLRRVLR